MLESFNNSTITYFADRNHSEFFFSELLISVIEELRGTVNNTEIKVYPDATIKPNGLPTGVACLAKPEDVILLPHILRDPGCGYLIFKFEINDNVDSNWHHAAGQFLDELINKKSPSQEKKAINLAEIMNQGLYALNPKPDEINCFANLPVAIDTHLVKPTVEESELLIDGFQEITNTVEIRKISPANNLQSLADYDLSENQYIGFIHSGSLDFPHALGKRFVYNIAQYADENNLFTLDQIKRGIFGVPLNTKLGKEYQQWLQAAMNYAVAGRLAAYRRIKQALESFLPCKLTLLKDSTHAGIFNKAINGEDYIVTSRGVQDISFETNHNQFGQLNLLAGQRETIAALVRPGKQASHYQEFFSHGTSYHIKPNYDYSQNFAANEIHHYEELAQNTFYNSVPQLEDSLAYTYNLLSSIDYFEKIGLATPISWLEPLINIQSKWLNN